MIFIIADSVFPYLVFDCFHKEFIKSKLFGIILVIVAVPITLCLLAPLGVVESGMQFILNSIYGFAPWLALALFAGLMLFIIMTSMHQTFIPTGLMALANPGYDLILPLPQFPHSSPVSLTQCRLQWNSLIIISPDYKKQKKLKKT